MKAENKTDTKPKLAHEVCNACKNRSQCRLAVAEGRCENLRH